MFPVLRRRWKPPAKPHWYMASFALTTEGDTVRIECWGPEADRLAHDVAATIRLVGPVRSGALAASVRIEDGSTVLIGGPEASHALFLKRQLGELAQIVLLGGPLPGPEPEPDLEEA